MRTPKQALAVAKHIAETHYRWPVGFCLGAVRYDFDAPYAFGNAAANWYASPEKYCHYNTHAPAGYPVSWLGGRRGKGHVAISAGLINGVWMCYTTDFGPNGYIGDGRVRLVPITSISKHDPLLRFRGWATWFEGVRLPTP